MKKYVYVGRQGNSLLIRNVLEDSERINKYPYTLFSPCKEKTSYISWNKKNNLEPVVFNSIKEMNDWKSEYEGIDNFPIFGQDNPIYQFIYGTYDKNLVVNKKDYFICVLDIETARDPDRGYAKPSDPFCPILSIQLKDSRSGKTIVFGYGHKYTKSQECDIEIDYREAGSEEEMLDNFLHYWLHNYPDILTGWNTTFFDIPYITNRIHMYVFPGDADRLKMLSPFNLIRARDVKDLFGRVEETFDWVGIVHLDYLKLYKKYTYNAKDSYTLNNIASIELGKEKVDYSDVENLQKLYETDYSRWIFYGAKDTALVSELDDKMRFIELIIIVAYKMGCNIEDVFSPVRSWEIFISNELRKERKITPLLSQKKPHYPYIGAYVKDIVPGRYNWVQSFDLASLYPHIQMELNISPEMLIEEKLLPEDLLKIKDQLNLSTVDNVVNDNDNGIHKILNKEIDLSTLQKYNVTVSPAGHFYRKTEVGFFPKILKALYDERVIIKKEMLQLQQEYEDTKDESIGYKITSFNAKQKAIKIILNSGYGAFASKYFFWSDTRNAESITSMGQVVIKWAEKRINDYMNTVEEKCQVIAADTDSLYIHLGPLVEKHFSEMSDNKISKVLVKFGNDKLQPIINDGYEELKDYLNAYEQKMSMKMEVVAPTSIFIAKKRYLMSKLYEEGVIFKEPKIKMMGVDAVKSSTPSLCRDALKEAISICLLQDEIKLQEFVADFKQKFFSSGVDDISFPRSVNGLKKYSDSFSIFKKRTPIAVRGALVFNHFHKKHNITNMELINQSDKVKFFYMNLPNHYASNILSFVSGIPEEFPKINIDYKTQFEKSFLKPLDSILTAIGWEHEKTTNLMSFFT